MFMRAQTHRGPLTAGLAMVAMLAVLAFASVESVHAYAHFESGLENDCVACQATRSAASTAPDAGTELRPHHDEYTLVVPTTAVLCASRAVAAVSERGPPRVAPLFK